jgi:hypothetical protein
LSAFAASVEPFKGNEFSALRVGRHAKIIAKCASTEPQGGISNSFKTNNDALHRPYNGLPDIVIDSFYAIITLS